MSWLVDSTVPTADGCEAITNAAALAGNIALIDRGICAFAAKVQAAQDAGAIGVIVVNNVAGPAASMGGASATVTIPAIMVSQADGNLLKAELATGLFASIQTSATRRAGTDDRRPPAGLHAEPAAVGVVGVALRRERHRRTC